MTSLKKTALFLGLALCIASVSGLTACKKSGGKTPIFPIAGNDTTPPTIATTYPDTGETDVPINDNIAVEFSEDMDETSVISAITVTNAYGNVDGTVTYANKIATFNPTIDFYEIMDYTVTVSMAALDTAGNALAADYTWTFTTGYLVNAVDPTPGGDDGGAITAHAYSRSVSLTWFLALDDVTRQGRLQYRVLQSDSADTMDRSDPR